MKSVLGFILLFNFTLGLGVEAYSAHDGDSFTQDQKVSQSAEVKDVDCENCDPPECDDSNDHCIHHCSGLHKAYYENSNNQVSFGLYSETSAFWSFHNLYKSYDLSANFRPPIS